MVFERRKLQNWPFYTTSAAFLSQNAPTDSAEEALFQGAPGPHRLRSDAIRREVDELVAATDRAASY